MKKIIALLSLAFWVMGSGLTHADLGAGMGNPSAKTMVKKGKAALKAGKLEEAFDWFLRGAQKEDPAAENMAGKCYENGMGTDKSVREAVTWYKKSALQGYADGENNMANCYVHGIGVRKDDLEAFKYYHMAATHGSSAAAYNLGYIYELGVGVPKNLDAARHFYRMSAKKGYTLAQSRLRQMER